MVFEKHHTGEEKSMHNEPYTTHRGIISLFSLSFFSMNTLVFSALYYRGNWDRRDASIDCVPRNINPLWNTVSFSFSRSPSLCFRPLLRFFHPYLLSGLAVFARTRRQSSPAALDWSGSSVNTGKKGHVMSIRAITVAIWRQLICRGL